MNKYNESKYLIEELHRGKWQPFMNDKGKQKFALITEDQARELNLYANDRGTRYVLEASKPKAEKTAEKTDGIAELRAEYEKVFGKKPYGAWKEDQLKEKIAEATKQ